MNTLTRAGSVLLASVAALAITLTIGAAPAMADTTGQPFTFKSAGDGLTNVVPDGSGTRWPAMSYILTSDGSDVTTYCVQFATPLNEGASFAPTAWGSSSVSGLAKAADIAARHASIGTPYADARWEAAATQAAIWNVTNGVDPTATGNDEFAARVNQILAGATDASQPSWQLTITPVATVNPNATIRVTTTVTDNAGPMAGSNVRVKVEDVVFTAVADGSGVAVVDVPAVYAGKTATVSASKNVGPGVFLQASAGQSLITASAASIVSSNTVALPATPAPSPTPTPTPTPTPAPTNTPVTPTPSGTPEVVALDTAAPASPEAVVTEAAPEVVVTADKPDTNKPKDTPKELPNTGSNITPGIIALLLGVALLGGAGAIYFRTRKS